MSLTFANIVNAFSVILGAAYAGLGFWIAGRNLRQVLRVSGTDRSPHGRVVWNEALGT